MKMPTEFNSDILGYEGNFGEELPDGVSLKTAHESVFSLIYPPIGFFPFYGIGNGDYHGFYWPVGREDELPIVAFNSHSVGSLIPENSTIDGLHKCELSRTGEPTYFDLVTQVNGQQPTKENVPELSHDNYDGLLNLDPKSPFLLCAIADGHLANNEAEKAEQNYRKSLSILPEYVAAHFGLASALRRQRNQQEAAIHLRHTLIESPLFYGGSFWAETSLPGTFRGDWRRKALLWLQRYQAVNNKLIDDPFFKVSRELSFQAGLSINPDIDILNNVLQEYIDRNQFGDAVKIWHLIGCLASTETTSFRERIGLTPIVFGERLVELYKQSGNSQRAKLARNMVDLLREPNGQYL